MSERLHRDEIPRGDPRFWGKLDQYERNKIGYPRGRETWFVKAPDGRRLAVETYGNPAGYTVVLMHGSLGSRTGPVVSPSMLHGMGINIISYDRPGYGYSDPHPGRRPIDSAADVAAILDTMGVVTDVSLIGRSGGGPHALACAATVEGVRNVALLASPAPRTALGERYTTGLGHANRNDLAAVDRQADDIEQRVKQIQYDPVTHMNVIEPDFAPDDHRVVRGNLRAEILAAWSEAVRFGPEGWLEDIRGNNDWGFSPADVQVSTLVWYGGQDPFVPPVNGRWLADNIPGAQEIYVPEASHFRASYEIVPAVLGWCATGEYRP